MIAIRGAITVDTNTKKDILEATTSLLEEIMKVNHLVNEDILSIFFTATKDLTKVYPAVAAREMDLTNCSLLCTQEMDVEGSLNMCIRVLLHVEKKLEEVNHIYLKGAKILRPDIANKNHFFSIAIDGPAGAGKSTIAKKVANELHCIYVDTGAMYRAVGYYCFKHNATSDEDIKKRIEEDIDKIDVSIQFVDGIQRVFLGEEDVSEVIRSNDVSPLASKVAVYEAVRTRMVELQREMARKESVVMDGRDIGTVVLRDATVKIYLTASSLVRAKRRYNELLTKGEQHTVETLEREIIERDERDMNREFAPLKKAEDAMVIDSSYMGIDEVVEKILSLL